VRTESWLVVLATAASVNVARADSPPAPSAPTKGYVDLDVRGPDDAAAAVTTALRELLARLGLDLRTAAPPSSPGAPAPAFDPQDRAHVIVDESLADQVDIVVIPLQQGHPAPSVTRTLPKGGSTAILTEQIAHVIHATLESLLTIEAEPLPQTTPAPTPPPPPTPTPTPTPPPAPSLAPALSPDHPPPPTPGGGPGLAAMLFATGSGVTTSSGAVLGGGGEARLSLGRGFVHPSFWLQGSTGASFAERTADVTVQTNVTSLRAGADVSLVSTHLFGVEAGVGAGADVFHAVPMDAGSGFALEPTMDLVDPMFTARALASLRLVAGVRVVAGVDLDVDLDAHRYVTLLDSGAWDSVYRPWSARPTVLLGVCVPLLGGEGCVQ
jgi:hypothetical protein